MDDITEILNLKDENLKIIDTFIENDTKIVVIEKELIPHYCPECGFRMHSKGIKIRTVRHQMLQDGYKLVLKIRQRRWLCTNPYCRNDISDSFGFVEKSKQTTNANEILVLNALRDVKKTFVDVANEFNISDTQVIRIFEKHIQMKRLPLPEAISVDEVYLNMDSQSKYALIIQDFCTGDIIDIVESRRDKYTEPYFSSIPLDERNNVKYVISDMYNPYIDYTEKYFHKAISIVDSFHVSQWLNAKIEAFLRSLLRQYRDKDRARAQEYATKKGKSIEEVYIKKSDEVYLLENCKWVVLRNRNNIRYYEEHRWNGHFGFKVNTYFLEQRFLNIHPDLTKIRDLKEEYTEFNSTHFEDSSSISQALDELIEIYEKSKIAIFVEFSKTLKKHKIEIINSFIVLKREIKGELVESRLSNGPIESLNRKIKDVKRLSRGYRNFDHFRNRLLYLLRKFPTING